MEVLSGFWRCGALGAGGELKNGASWSQGVEGPGMPRTVHPEDQPLAPLSSPALPFCEGSRGSGVGSARQSPSHSGRPHHALERVRHAGPRARDGGDVWVGGRA